jgi:hypothetical protein
MELSRQSEMLILEDNPIFEWIKSIPKVDLHVHLDGSLRVNTLLDLYPEGSTRDEIVKCAVAPEKCTSEDALG